jgi:hypothetical protein
MARISKYLRNWSDLDGERSGFTHWCPGCDAAHEYVTERRDGKHDADHPVWTFNGNVESPTFSPSMRLFIPAHDGLPMKTMCHYILTAGKIEFCIDSAHALSGKIVPLPELPPESDYHYADMPSPA